MLHKNLDGAELRTDQRGSGRVRKSPRGTQIRADKRWWCLDQGRAARRRRAPLLSLLEGIADSWDVRMRGESRTTPRYMSRALEGQGCSVLRRARLGWVASSSFLVSRCLVDFRVEPVLQTWSSRKDAGLPGSD